MSKITPTLLRWQVGNSHDLSGTLSYSTVTTTAGSGHTGQRGGGGGRGRENYRSSENTERKRNTNPVDKRAFLSGLCQHQQGYDASTNWFLRKEVAYHSTNDPKST